MQMESWRERGFVPDSDDEDGFESQEKGVNQDVYSDKAAPTESAAQTEEVVGTAGKGGEGVNNGQRDDARDDNLGFVEGDQEGPDILEDVTTPVEEDIDLPLPDAQPQGLNHDDREYSLDLGDTGGDDGISAREEDTPRAQTPDELSRAAEGKQSSTPRPRQQRDYWDMPSSSPDLLQLDHHPWRKKSSPAATPTPKAKEASQPRQSNENVASSPLSSPLSSLHSSILAGNDHQRAEDLPDQNLEELLPPLDIPDDILRQLDQPARRSLRQRNPIQLHPYLLEDAKYQKLMKARGVKPVRITQQELQRARIAAAESQGQNLGDDAGSSSDTQMTSFQFNPSSPIDPRQLFDITPLEGTADNDNRQVLQRPGPSVNTTGPRSPKRRKVSGPGDSRQRQNNRPLSPPAPPQVVISNPSSSLPRDVSSIFDIPSPPRSGSISSPPVRGDTGFRFPRGFSPPNPTPRTETKRSTADINDRTVVIDEAENRADQESDDSRTVRSESPHSSPTSDLDEEDDNNAHEAAVRKYQRKIKGVLPASWLRLDQQNRKGPPGSTQRNHDRLSRLDAEAAKGVARKITKRPDAPAPSSARDQFLSLRELAEESDSESAENRDDSDSVEPHQRLASLFGPDDSFNDQDPDGDIPEDNRIDYMFPAMSRNPTLSNGQNRSKKRRRSKTNETRFYDQPKKPRLKRQARLTEPIYGGQKKKPRPSQRLPNLGILDTPDVASQPRKEQPQFLRVAARNARSRQDRGRRSPTRKVIRLNSRLDTDDANASLREWRAGRLRQATLPRAPHQHKHPRRQPLKDLSTNARDVFNGLGAKRTRERNLPTNNQLAGPSRNNNAAGGETATIDARPDSTPDTRNAAPRPVQQRRGNAWVIQRNFAISSLSRNNARPVMPEIENRASDARELPSLQGPLALLARDERLPLNRFLSGAAGPHNSLRETTEPDKSNHAPNPVAGSRPRQLKKRQPKRLNITTIEDYAQPVIQSPELESAESRSSGQLARVKTVGQPNRFRTAYSIEFGISPLHSGIFFHETTFIGSGEFSRSLDISKRELDKSTGLFHFRFGDQSMRWGAWDDSVSSQLGTTFDQIIETADAGKTAGKLRETSEDLVNSDCAVYRSVIKYTSEALSFIDPIDRVGFVTRATGLISKTMEILSSLVLTAGDDTGQVLKIASYNVAFANLVYQISNYRLVNQSIRDEAFDLTKSASRQVVSLISNPIGQSSVQRFLAATKSQELREGGIKNDHPTVEAYVIVQHVLRSAEEFKGCLQDFIADAYATQDVQSAGEKDIGSLENGWQGVFMTLPLQEIDSLGISRVGSRFRGGYDNWAVVKRLLSPIFDSDEANSEFQPISYYSYCRVLFQRCFALINGWGWRDCKPILDTLYDFFAKRTLYNLRLEESHRSPAFLDELDGHPSFDVFPGDPCFHILLKIIASGLRFLSGTYNKKKILSYTWRLLPNHGRNYPKEQPIHEADLDALRNHHDLICTLYSSVPDGCRPRLGTIKDLVNPATSHFETCKISIQSWTRLARFKLTTNEDISGLEPFAEWHCYFVSEFIKQHNLARREIEAQNAGGKQFPQQLIERTVAENQRQIENLLKTALQGLQNAVRTAPTLDHAYKIVSQTPIKSILDLFNSRITRLNATVLEGLQVIVMYVQKCSSISPEQPVMPAGNPSFSTDDDSQEYGDWTDIEAVYGYEPSPVPPGVEHVEKVFHPAVSRLVSNCFGEDRSPDDAILNGVVDCWTSVANTLVRHGLRRWDSYISPYEVDSWVALRWTTQTRKFTPQFLAKCIEKEGQILSECKIQILGIWLSSLVERASMLKFQHCLTEAILNQDAEDPVLKNLPFSRDAKEGRYSISYVELSQRRLSLISSLLSNMRAHLQDLDDTKSQELSSMRQEYREAIQKMMSSMKANYQELGNADQGDYVHFVHRIVGFLQQHTRDICPIDSFFTDPASFPLPKNDPTYIVARLKSYEPKLSSAKLAKTLVIFVQGVSERAALDGEQTYLVSQLHEAISKTYEAGNLEQPTLRATLLRGVFPAYLATAFENPTAWILSWPIIETTTRVFKELLFNMDATHPDCVRSVVDISSAVLEPSYRALHRIVVDTNLLDKPTVLITAAAFLDMIISTLPVIDYIDRVTTDPSSTRSIIAQIRAIQKLALFMISNLQSQPHLSPDLPINITLPTETRPQSSPQLSTSDTSLSATLELQTYINENWAQHQGKYYFTRRGHQPQEITIEAPMSAKLDNLPDNRLLDAATALLDALDSLGLFGEGEEVVNNDMQFQSHNVWEDEILLL